MITELGYFCLLVAAFVAACQAVIPLIGTRFGRPDLAAIADPAAQIQFLMVLIAWFASVGCWVWERGLGEARRQG